MKKLLITLLLIVHSINWGQTTKEPFVSSSNTDNTIIESISIEKKSTNVLLSYWKTRSNKYQAWVSFSSNTYIIDNDTKRRYKIISLRNLEGKLELDQRYSTENGRIGKVKGNGTTAYLFNFEFPPLPPGVENIDIVEELNGEYGFIWKGIRINNPDNSQSTSWTQSSIKKDWEINGIDQIEGIYENTTSNQFDVKYTIAVKKNNDTYEAIYLSGSEDSKWKIGDIKAFISETASPNIYKTIWYMGDKRLNENVYTSFENGLMKLIWTDKNEQTLYIKLYPSSSNNSSISSSIPSTGTGFAISHDGYIVTNHHVVNGAKKIKVRGIKGDFNKLYEAKIAVEDKNNDLAIIKIDDAKFTTLGTIPYSFDYTIKDSGVSVFALGYPLLSSMGDEIKLTNGIISSKTGFQGDITTYQTTVPVQPGNSGGPLLDNKGNVIGIINAKHNQADNASYAIKSNYLYNLIQTLDTNLKLKKENTILSKMSLSEKVKYVKEFIYIIEIN